MGVEVSRLTLAARPGLIGRLQQYSEDALRLAANDDGRLVVLRQLNLGALPARANATAWAERAQDLLRQQRLRAVHGGQPGAAAADSIWFASAEEARTILLRLIAAGQRPTAWFWRLAVENWRSDEPEAWFISLVQQASALIESRVALARAILAVIQDGNANWIARRIEPQLAQSQLLGTVRKSEPTVHACKPVAGQESDHVVQVRKILDRHSTATLDKVILIATDPTIHLVVKQWLAEQLLIATIPEIVCADAVLAEYGTILLASLIPVPDDLQKPPPISEPAVCQPLKTLNSLGEPGPTRTRPLVRNQHLPEAFPAKMAITANQEATVSAPEATPYLDQSEGETSEVRSVAAGTLLLVRPLIHLGLGKWLHDRPELLAKGFGRALLGYIALRMRVPADDPLFSALHLELPLETFDHFDIWRLGLDRWLRRTAHIRLSDVVRRRGWIIPGRENAAARFRLDDAEIRLRRFGLDVDPGWVDWLGLSIRFHFSDGPVR